MAKKPKHFRSEPTEQQLWKQLAAAPVVEVLGVLAADGVAGVWSQGDTLWTLLFTFASWRIPDRELQTKELIVRRQVTTGEIDKYQKLIKPDVVTRIRARVVEKSVFGRREALLVKVLGPDDSDAELNAEIRRLKKPVRFKDKDFGTFTLDRSINWFYTTTVWNGRKVRLALAADKPGNVKRSLQVARALWRAQKTWQNKVLACAAKELLPVKNGNWLGEGEQKLSAQEFKDRMKLERITVRPNGSFDFWHNDGDLFWGHSIEVIGSLKKGPKYANMHG